MEQKIPTQRESLESNLAKYFNSLDPRVFNENSRLNVTRIEHMGAGTRHFNYLAVINGKSYNIRFSLTSHPESHVEYEYMSLKAVEPLRIAPKAEYHEASKKHLGIPFVVIEYVDGVHPDAFTPQLLESLAKIVTSLHETDVNAKVYSGLRKKSTKADILSVVKEKANYISRKAAKHGGNGGFGSIVRNAYAKVDGIELEDHVRGVLSHGDIALSNIIITKSGIRLIDWETLNIGDPAYDIATFFDRSELTGEQKSLFLGEYLKHTSNPKEFISRLEKFEKIRVFDRFCWCIWEAFDVYEGARDGFFPIWRTVALYVENARRRFEKCRELGVIPKEAKWEDLCVEKMFTGTEIALASNGNAMMRKAAIFDVDNTLLFTDKALEKAQVKMLGRSMPSEEFNQLPRALKIKVIESSCTEFMDEATPNTLLIDKMRELKGNGYTIIVLTSRPMSVERYTREKLRRHGAVYDEIYHNPNSVEVKQTRFKTLKLPEIAKDFGHVEVYDDHMKVFESYVQSGIKHIFYHVKKDGTLRLN